MSFFNLFKKEQVLYAQDLIGDNISIWNLNAALSLSHKTELEKQNRLFLKDIVCYLDLDTEKQFIQIHNVFGTEGVKNGSDEAFLQFCNEMNLTYMMIKLAYEKDSKYIACGYDYLYEDKINLPHLNATLRGVGEIIRDVYCQFAEKFPDEEKPEEQAKGKDQ